MSSRFFARFANVTLAAFPALVVALFAKGVRERHEQVTGAPIGGALTFAGVVLIGLALGFGVSIVYRAWAGAAFSGAVSVLLSMQALPLLHLDIHWPSRWDIAFYAILVLGVLAAIQLAVQHTLGTRSSGPVPAPTSYDYRRAAAVHDRVWKDAADRFDGQGATRASSRANDLRSSADALDEEYRHGVLRFAAAGVAIIAVALIVVQVREVVG